MPFLAGAVAADGNASNVDVAVVETRHHTITPIYRYPNYRSLKGPKVRCACRPYHRAPFFGSCIAVAVSWSPVSRSAVVPTSQSAARRRATVQWLRQQNSCRKPTWQDVIAIRYDSCCMQDIDRHVLLHERILVSEHEDVSGMPPAP